MTDKRPAATDEPSKWPRVRKGVGKETGKGPTTVAVTVRLPASLKNKCQAIANKDGRTLNNWILMQIKEAAK